MKYNSIIKEYLSKGILNRQMWALNKVFLQHLWKSKRICLYHHTSSFYSFNDAFLNNSKNFFINKREISTTVSSFFIHDKRIFEYDRKGGDEPHPKPKVTLKDIKKGFLQLRTEIIKWREEMKEKFENDNIFIRPGDTDIIFPFKTEEDIKKWKITCDSDHNQGLSSASITLSPNGKGLFTGRTDTTILKDGKLKGAGYANMTVMKQRRSFMRDKPFNWEMYTHIVMRIRGDGRKYLLNVLTPGAYDVTWFDMFSYILYTRGGPYWQDVKIPFSKFLWNSRGFTQDDQKRIPLNRVERIGITAAGGITGPFRLEIDYIGVHYDPTHTEHFAYEKYNVPAFL